MYFEKTYPIDSTALDCFNLCRASAILGYLQDTAGLAAAQFGASREDMMKKYGHFWMVIRTGFTLDRPLRWGDSLTVKTWHRGGSKPLMFRDFDLFVDGEVIGQALSIWVLASAADRSMARPDRFPEFAGTDGGALIRDTRLPKLKLPAEMAPAERRLLRYSDTDANGHVNNTRYADFLCDALELQTAPQGSFVRELSLGYLRECRAGETLELLTAREDGRGYVLGRDEEGDARFHGYAVFSESPS